MNLQNSKGIQFCVNVAVITAHAYHLTAALLLTMDMLIIVNDLPFHKRKY